MFRSQKLNKQATLELSYRLKHWSKYNFINQVIEYVLASWQLLLLVHCGYSPIGAIQFAVQQAALQHLIWWYCYDSKCRDSAAKIGLAQAWG